MSKSKDLRWSTVLQTGKSDYYNEALKAAKDGLSIGDTSAVKEDLTLPATLDNGVNVSWGDKLKLL